MKLRTRALGVCLLATLAAAAAIGSGTAAAATSPVVGHVYVNDDTAGTNTIAGFNRHADGTLTPMTGSPFPAGGAGAGSGLAARARCRLRPVAACCWRSIPAATRSRCFGSGQAERSPRSRVAASCVARHPAGQHRGSRKPRLRRQRRQRRQQLHRVPAGAVRPPAAPAGIDREPARRLASLGTCCSTRPAPTWPARGSAPR